VVTRVLIAAGGTGGHIVPAMGVALELRARGCEVLMVGNSGGMEEGIYTRAGLPYRVVDSQKLYRRFTFAHVRFPFKLLGSICAAMRYIREFRPDAFLGTGSFVAGPVGLAAILSGVPVFIQEQNSYPGLANRWLARRARRIYTGYEGACRILPAARCLHTGNPVLPAAAATTDDPIAGLRGNPVLLVIGGSQGSRVLNEALAPIVPDLLAGGLDIVWQTGAANLDAMRARFGNAPGLHLFGFTDNMPRYYRAASFAMGRAGALTLAELEIYRLPALFVPLPSSGANRQYYNALELTSKGRALLLEQQDLTPGSLRVSLERLRVGAPLMKTKFTDCPHLTAAKTIVDDMLDAIAGGKKC